MGRRLLMCGADGRVDDADAGRWLQLVVGSLVDSHGMLHGHFTTYLVKGNEQTSTVWVSIEDGMENQTENGNL